VTLGLLGMIRMRQKEGLGLPLKMAGSSWDNNRSFIQYRFSISSLGWCPLMVEPNNYIIPLSKVKLCFSYLKSLGQPYSYEDGLEFAKVSLLFNQYMQKNEGFSSMVPPNRLKDFSILDKLYQVSYAAIERISQFLKSIGFEGRKTNCIEVVRAGRH